MRVVRDCEDCDGKGYTTGSEHPHRCNGEGSFCWEHCPVPVQVECETWFATGEIEEEGD